MIPSARPKAVNATRMGAGTSAAANRRPVGISPTRPPAWLRCAWRTAAGAAATRWPPKPFSKSILGLDIHYLCRNEDTSRTLTIAQTPGRPDGFVKRLKAVCDGKDQVMENVGAPSATTLFVSIDDPGAIIDVYGFR